MQQQSNPPLSRLAVWLDSRPRVVLTVFAMTAAFAAYTSMYAFRKPLAATDYNGVAGINLLGVTFDYKAIALISQLLGYMCSKFLGVKFASEASFSQRAPIVLGLIGAAQVALVLFGFVPAPYNLIFLFFNGLPLGMVWSMLFGILEGRRVTEFLLLGLSVSVVFSSGITKAVGRWTLEQGTPQFWMPALTGLIFTPLLLLSLYMLRNVPPPDEEDQADRTERRPMKRQERHAFFREFSLGIVLLLIGYLCLMTYRALRDDFMDVILEDLGYSIKSDDFFWIESTVGLCVIAVLCLLWFFRSHRHAVWANMTLISLGAFVIGASTILLNGRYVSPKSFYLINGIGLYIAYVPFQSILIDRLLASLHTVATGAFVLALADSAGYVSVVGIYLTKNVYAEVAGVEINWATMLIGTSYVTVVAVPLSMLGCALYFRPRMKDLSEVKKAD